jgi:putative cell wall-binding protein
MKRSLAVAALAVLTVCLAAGLAAPPGADAITRAEILKRSQRWVELGVPYSQTSYFEGYRQDCSGMASMAWKLSQSHSTRTLASQGVRISRDEIQPGDMMLKYNYHAAIFYKWADASHNWYWTLEESGSSGTAVTRLTKYPYWSQEGFEVFRPANIVEVNDYEPYIRPLSGSNRYATALAASRLAFENGEATATVLCSGEDWPDALGASALAGALGGPMLLTHPEVLPGGLVAELARLGVHNIVIVGGENAISPEVEKSLRAIAGLSVKRVGGANRYETAALVASETVTTSRARGREFDHTVYLATGETFADALGAATASALTGRPILLARRDSMPAVTRTALRSLETTAVYVAGGFQALTTTVTAGLSAEGEFAVTRFAGRDRYETALMLARHAADYGLEWDGVALATGDGFADALAGAVMQARLGAPLVLTPTGHLSPAADWAIREHADEIYRVTVLGGEAAVSPLVRRQIRWILREP